MTGNELTRLDAEALRAALELENEPTDAETANALRALAPALNRAALCLNENRAKLRAERLQAWALAGCTALFAALAFLAWQCRGFLLATPLHWAPLAAFALAAVLAVGCLPLMISKNEREDT